MKNILMDLSDFISTLSVVDYVFFVAIITLLILLVVLVYILRINEEEIQIDDNIIKPNTDDELDLVALSKELESSSKKENVTLTNYEQEQEAKAIISYDELMSTSLNNNINYKEEENLEGLMVKAIDVNNLINTMDPAPITHPATYTQTDHKPNLIKYDKEEEFLATLKKLQKLLD